jgi:hypothetical protein
MQTASTGGYGAIAHVSHQPVYVAPASHVFEVAPTGHPPIAPPGRTQPSEASSGKGIGVDANA